MNEQRRPKRWKRWLKRGLVVLLLLVTAALVAHRVWDYRASKVLQRELDAIRAAGDPLTLDELWPPEIEPASDNAAYVYEEASELFARLGFDDFEASAGDGVSCSNPAAWSEETVVAIRDTLVKCAEPLALARKAAHMQRCRFDLKPGFPPLPSPGRIKALRKTSRALCWSSGLRALDGDMHEALQEARAAFLTSRALADEPTLLSLTVRQVVMVIALQAAQSLLREHHPDRAVCRAFLEDIREARTTVRPHLVTAYKGERALIVVTTAQFLGQRGLLPAPSRSGWP